MKKIKLFLAAIAAMVTMGVQAQSWTASEVGAGNYMLYNVGTGQYLTRGNGWGTQASITTATTAGNGIAVKIEAVGSDFKLRTDINGDAKGLEHLNGGTIYTDQSANKNSTWTFTQVGTDNGPVYTIMSKDNHGGGANVYLTAGVDGTIVTPGTDGTIAGAQWKLMAIPAQPIGMDAASEANPVDATSLIVNANFSFPAILKNDSWTMVSNNYNACGGEVTNPNAESWRAAFTLSQTITVPNGIYELTAQATVTEYTVTGANLPVVYAGDQSTPFTAMTEGESSMSGVSTSFTAGKYVVGPIRVVVTNGSLTIGVRGTRTDTWCVWDNFKLTYKGVDLSALKEALQAQIDAVPDLEGTTTAAAYNAAKNYADGIDVASLNTEDAISAASTELANRVNAAKALQSAYAGYLAFKSSVDALDDDASIFTGDATIDLSAIDATIQATTTLEALNAAIETAKPQIQAAAATFLSSVTVNEGKRFDITNIYLTNPDFEVPTASGVLPPGWTITITGQNCGQQNRTDTNPETGLAITNFIEAWHPSQLGSGVIAQTVSSLPEGTYVLECDASVCHDPAGADDITGANLYVQSSLKKETKAISNVRLYINHYTVEFVHGGVGSVTFGLEANNTNANWLSADNFKVYFAGGIDLSVFADALAEAVTEFEALEASSAAANYAIYKAIVDENNKTWNNSAEYQAAIDAVHGATADLQAINAVVATYNTALEAAKTTVAKEDRMAASLRTALSSTISAYEDNVDVTSKTALEAATAALNAAKAKCETSIASYAIIAAGIIPDNSIDGWVCENEQTFHVNTWSEEGNPGNDPSNMVTPFIENWVGRGEYLGAGKVYYRLEGLEPGEVYRASALVRSYNEADATAPNGPNFYVNNAVTDLSTDGNTFTYNNMSGIYATLATGATVDENGRLELGVVIAADRNYNWVAFKNVRIQTYEAALAAAVALVDAIDASTIPADAYQTLQGVKTANNKTWSSAAEYEDAIAALETAAANAAAYVEPYANYLAAKEAAEEAFAAQAYQNVTGSEKTALSSAIAAEPITVADYQSATTELNSAVTAFTAAAYNYNLYASELAIAQAISSTITVEVPTSADEALAAFKTLKVAEYTFVANAYKYSATSKIGEFSTWTRSGSVNGNTNVSFEQLTSQHWSGTAMTYYEQPVGGWSTSGATFTANYEKICKLPAGEYVIKVAARAASGTNTTAKITCSAATMDGPIPNLGDNGKGITTAGVASFDDGEFANGGSGRGWVWNYLPFTLTEETEVTMTVVAEANGVMQWFSVCDGELLSKTNIATAVAYDETTTNTIEDVDVANVTMTRTIKADFNTVVLPFDLTSSQVQTAFGSGTEVYAFSDSGDDAQSVTINFNKIIAGNISANVPVLVKATAESTSQTFEGVQVVAPTEDVKVEGTYFDFVGVYAPMTVAALDYFIGNGAIYKSAGATSMKAFRAYIFNKDKSNGGEVKLYIDGLETAIDAINADATESGVIYNIAGQRVNKAQKGLYIVNGKKVLVK